VDTACSINGQESMVMKHLTLWSSQQKAPHMQREGLFKKTSNAKCCSAQKPENPLQVVFADKAVVPSCCLDTCRNNLTAVQILYTCHIDLLEAISCQPKVARGIWNW